MADAFFTCTTDWTQAEVRANQRFAFVDNITTLTFDKALDVVDKISHLTMPNLSFTVDIAPFTDIAIQPYTKAPTLDELALDKMPVLPPNPEDLPPVTLADIGPAPAPPANPPVPVFDAEPTVYQPVFKSPPTITLPDTPELIDYTGALPPPVPREIVLPVAPDINLDAILFDATPPFFDAVAPNATDFAYVEPDYNPQMASQIKVALLRMLNGQSGWPTPVEDKIWARQAEREDEQANRAIEDLEDDLVSRGFGIPNGVRNKQARVIKQNNQNQRNSLGRDTAIKAIDVLLDQLKTSIASSLQYEDMFIRLFNAQQDRKLQAARFAIDLAIAVYNAKVGLFQAQASVYKTQSDVYLARIQAEVAKIQVYSEQIRAQQLIGELNQQDIQIYLGRLQAIETNVRAYLAATEAYKNLVDGQRLILENARLLIEEEQAKLNASKIQSDIWLGQAQQQQIVQQSYQTRAQTYVATMNGYDIRGRLELGRLQADIANKDAVTKRYEALLEGISTLATLIKTRADLVIANNTQKVQVYSADVQGKSAYNTALVSKIDSINRAVEAETRIALENADINKRNILAGITNTLKQLEMMASVLTGMGSAALSAAHVGVQVSDASSVGSSCNFNTSQTIG